MPTSLFKAGVQGVARLFEVPDSARHSLIRDTIAGCLAGFYMGMIFPFVTKVARGELGATAFWLALLSAAPFVGNVLAPAFAARMERRAAMGFLLGSWIPARCLLLLLPLFPSATGFSILVGGVQLIGAFASPAYASVMSEIYPPSHRGRLMGIVRVGVQACSFVAAQFAGRFMDSGVSYRILFPIAGLMGVAAALVFAGVRPFGNSVRESPIPQSEPSAWGAFRDSIAILVENKPYRWFAASVMAYGFGNLMAIPLYGLFQVDVLRITNTQIAALANVASLCSIPASFFWGRYMDRHGPSRTCTWSILWVSGIGVCYLFADSMLLLWGAAVCSGIGFAGIEISYLQSTLMFSDEDGRPARYQALHSLLLGIRGIIAPLVSLALLPLVGFAPLFWATLILMICGAALQSRVQASWSMHRG